VLVRGVTVKKFMLHQTGQLAKLRNITAKIIDPVHETERAADLAFLGQDFFENFALQDFVLSIRRLQRKCLPANARRS
jgi:hypothetical protein